MINKLVLISALMLGTAAYAQDAAPAPAPEAAAAPAANVPVCSKTVTDKCINRTARTTVHSHKKTVAKTSKITTKQS